MPKTVTNLQNTVDQAIPVYLNREDFNEYILPLLWKGGRGPACKVGPYKMFHYILYVLYTGCQWKMLPVDRGPDGGPEIHYTRVWAKWKQWNEQGCIRAVFLESVRLLKERGRLGLSVLHGDGSNTAAKKGGQCVGYSGHKHQKGDKCVPIFDNAGNVLAPMTLAPANQPGMVLPPEALADLRRTCRECGVQVPKGTPLNLDPGFDSRKNRKAVHNAGLRPNIKENPRNRKKPKRGPKRYFDKQKYKLRYVCERGFAWQDKFRRIIVRSEWYKHLYHGFHLLAFALINFRNILN